MKRIYESGKGQWRVKGYFGYSATKQKAIQRMKGTQARAQPVRVFASVVKDITAEDKAGLANQLFSGTFYKGVKTSVNTFFRKREFKREAIIRGKQQKKLTGFL